MDALLMSVPIRGEVARHGTHPSVICLEFATNNSICEIKQPVNRSLSVIIGGAARKREREANCGFPAVVHAKK